MLDVFPLSYGFLVPQCRHTVTVLSTNLFPSSLYLTGKPKCSHLNDAGRSRSSVPPLAMSTLHLTSVWIEHAHNFFFFFCQSIHGSWIKDQWWSVAPLCMTAYFFNFVDCLTELYSHVCCRLKFWKRSLQLLPKLPLIPIKRSWRRLWNSVSSACTATRVRRASPATSRTTRLHRSEDLNYVQKSNLTRV